VKFLVMILGTALVGFVVGGLLALIGGLVIRGGLFGLGSLAGAVVGLLIGYPIGVITGIILFRKLFKYQGSLAYGVLGSLLGAAIPIILAEPLNVNITALWVFITFFIFSPVLGSIGFYLGKKAKKTDRKQPAGRR